MKMPTRGHSTPTSPCPEKSVALHDRLLWLCPIVGVLAGAIILLLFGFTLWTALALVFLIACPAMIVWVVVIARRQPPTTRRMP
jgi:hypothetical protein